MFGFFRRLKSVFTPSPSAEGAPTQAPDAAVPETSNQPSAKTTTTQSLSTEATVPKAEAEAAPASPKDLEPSTSMLPAQALHDDTQAFVAGNTTIPNSASEAVKTQSAPASSGWFARLKGGLAKTRNQLADLFGVVKIDEQLLEDLESALIQADAGVAATESLINALRQAIKQDKLKNGEAVRYCLRDLIRDQLIPLQGGIDLDRSTPLVLMIAGVNGAGKTTSIGKLARHVQREGKTVLLAAGDTFRAAAREQLAIWGQRNGVEVIAQQGGDPAAVAFDAVSAGRARQSGVVMIDTAGRLPTQNHLMDELKKIRRVIGKAMSDAPHEALLILDGNTGQNMLHQVKAFDEAISLTGLVVTKLDGTAKGGALLALAHQLKQRPIPVYFIGVGEGLDDLQAFRAEEFANALLDC